MKSQTNKEEQRVADKAKQMLTSALSSEISSSFKDHYRGSSSVKDGKKKQPLRDFEVKSSGRYFTNTEGEKYYYFNSLKLDIGIHGFIHNSGSNTIRSAHQVQRTKPRFIEYNRGISDYRLPKTNFIGNAIDRSGVVPYVAKEIGTLRGYAVLNDIMEQLAERLAKAKRGKYFSIEKEK